MSYIIGSLGAKKQDPFTGVLATFAGPVTDLIKSAIAQNFERYQAWNLFRFGVADIKKGSDSRLANLERRDSKGGMPKATPGFQVFEKVVVGPAAGVTYFTPTPTKKQMNDQGYEIWKTIWAAITPAMIAEGEAGTESAKDYTWYYVGGGVAALLLVVGLMRNTSSNKPSSGSAA